MDRCVAALLSRRSPTGCRRRRGSAVTALLRPLRFVCPIGWIGGRYTTSKPSSASCGSTRSTPAKPPHERGKSSYQTPKRASSTSTSTPSFTSSSVSRRAGRRSSPRAPPRGTARRRRAARVPRKARPSRSVCPPSSFRVTSSCHDAIAVGPRGDGVRPAARRVDGERAAPAVVAERLERRLAPAPRARRAVADVAAPRTCGPSRKIVAETTTSSPTTRLIGKRPQSTCGSTSRIWIAGGGSLRAGGTGVRLSQVDEPQTRQWNPAAPDVAARRAPRRGGVSLRRLARGGRPVVVAGAPARAPRTRGLAVQRLVGVRRHRPRCSPSRARRSRPTDVEDFVARHPFWTGDWAAFAGRGRARGPGSLRARVDRTARLRTRARRAHLRRRPDLRRRRKRRARRAPGALPRAARSRARRPTRCRSAASTGAIRSTTGARIARRATAGGSSGCAAPSSSSTWRASTISAASSRTGRSRPGTGPPSGAAGARARAPSCSAPPRRSSVSCRSSPRISE